MKYICPNCGVSFEDGSQFCNKCGTMLEAEAPTVTPYIPDLPEENETAPLEAYTPAYVPQEEASASPVAPLEAVSSDKKEKNGKKGKKKTGLVIGIICGVVTIPLLLIIILIIALSGGDDTDVQPDDTTSAPIVQQSTEALSDNIYDFNIKLNGTVYKFPEALTNFENAGWVIDADKKAETVEAQDSIELPAQNDTGYITLHIYNDGDTAKAVSECQVGGITLSFNRSNSYTIELSKGIVISEDTTMDDIAAIWGKYTHISWRNYSYKKASTLNDSCEYKFETSADGTLVSASVKNYDEDNIYSPGVEVAGQIVDIAEPAQALSNNFADGTIAINGKAFTLPMKLNDIISGGTWVVADGPSKLAPNEQWFICLGKNTNTSYTAMKNGYITATVINTTDKEIAIEDASVISVSYDCTDFSDVVEFTNGIKLGMSEAEFLKATNSLELEKSDSGTLIYYRSNYTEGKVNYTFVINTESKAISHIEIAYTPVTDTEALLESF